MIGDFVIPEQTDWPPNGSRVPVSYNFRKWVCWEYSLKIIDNKDKVTGRRKKSKKEEERERC